jgi:leader peptidase (prepilin peptidase)/N-methyltransferase
MQAPRFKPHNHLPIGRDEQEYRLVFWLPPLLVAPFAGSVAGVMVRRLPHRRPVGLARSACDHCNQPLAPHDLIPLVSIVLLRGRCRICNAPIARFHLAIELAAVAIALWAISATRTPSALWTACGLGWTLLALAWIDAEHLILPDALTLPLIIAGLAVTWWLNPAALASHALGAIAGYLGFRAIALTYRALRGREGLGAGDAKLLAAAGGWVGIAALPDLILAAGLLGLAVAIAARSPAARSITVWPPGAAIPFGPALALATFIVRLYR